MDGKHKTRVLFVRYQPGRSSSNSGQGEISQQKHAAREYHRRVKERRLSTRQKKEDQAVIRASPKPTTSSTGYVHVDVDATVKNRRAPAPLPSPSTVLGAGRVDPFNSYIVKNLSPHAHRMLDYSLTYQWPLFSIANPRATVEDMKRHVMSRLMHSATSLYSVIFVGATHWAISQHGADIPKENALLRLNYQDAALRQLAVDVQNAGSNLPNELLYVMMALAAFGKSGSTLRPPAYKPSPSVLATAHELELYSRLPIEWAHLRTLFHIIRQRGGLPAMARPGWALITSFYDILVSCQKLAVPTFPVLKSTDRLLRAWPPPQCETSLSLSLGSRFRGLSDDVVYARLCRVIGYVVQITLGYDRYEGRSPDAPLLYQIVHARSPAMHDLLSLPDSVGGDHGGSTGSVVYEMSRLGSIAYMLIYLYPIVPENGPHEKLARRLQELLKHAFALGMWETHSPLLLWVLILGGVTAQGFPLRSWYVHCLSNSGLKDGFLTWPAVSDVLTGFLWHESNCGRAGKELWDESGGMDRASISLE